MTTQTIITLAFSLLLFAGSGASAQQPNPGNLLAPGDGVVYGSVKSDGSRVQPETPGAEIVEFQARGPELMLQVTGDPGQLYFVMQSTDMRNWQFHDLAFEVGPGQFMMFSEGSGPDCQRKVFLKVERPRGPKPCDPYAHAQNLYRSVPFLDFLNGEQLTDAWTAATGVADAYQDFNGVKNTIIACTQVLQECLAQVEQLRQVAEAAEQVAEDAEAEAKRIEDEIGEGDDELFDLIQQRKEAEAEVRKWHDLWTTGSGMIADRNAQLGNITDPDQRASIQAEIDTIRSNMDSWIVKRNEAQDEVDALKQQEADKRAEGESRVPEMEAAQAAAEAARAAAEEAWRKVGEEMAKGDQIREDIRQKQGEAEEARKKLQEESEKFAAKRAALAAAGEAEKARQIAEADAKEEAERRRIEDAAARERARVERNMAAYQQWLRDIEQMHGASGMGAIIGAFLTSGGVEVAGSTVEGMADFLTGFGATNALATATSGLLQGGWSFIVAMAQKAAEKGLSGTVQNHIVKMAVQDFLKNGNPAPGTIGYFRVENENPDTTKNVTNSFMMVANADGSVTVFASSKRGSGAVKTYVVKR